jgi:pentatricopeptide repeat protein
MAAVELQANIDRRVAKLALLGDGEESKRARKREFAAIGKLRKQLAALKDQPSGNSTGKRSPLDAGVSATSDGSSRKKPKNNKKQKGAQGSVPPGKATSDDRSEAEDGDSDEDVSGNGGALSRKQEKQLVKSVNQKLAVAATRKQLKAALKVFASLSKRGLQGDVHTYTNVINCAVRCGQLAKAKELYDHMRSVRKMPPNVVTLTVLLKGYCEAGDVSGGKAMLDSECAVHRLAPNLRTANTLLRGCVRSGNTAVAVATLHDMAHKWAPPVAPDASCIVAVVSLLSRSLRLKEAQRVLATYATTPSNDSSSASLISSSDKGGVEGADASIIVPAAHVSVAKCAAVLRDWTACGRALAAAEVSLRFVTQQRQAARLRERVSATHALDAREDGAADDGFGNGKKVN